MRTLTLPDVDSCERARSAVRDLLRQSGARVLEVQDAGWAAYREKPRAPESLTAEVRRLTNRPSAAARVAVRDARHR